MNKGIKNALLLTAGAIVGFVGCVKVVCRFIDSKPQIKGAVCDEVIPPLKKKVTDSVYCLFYACTPEEYYRRGSGPFKSFVTDDIVFNSTKEAEDAIEDLKSIAANEGFVTEEELYETVDISKPRASKYCGWSPKMLDNAQVYCERGFYKLLLPTMRVNRFKYSSGWWQNNKKGAANV